MGACETWAGVGRRPTGAAGPESGPQGNPGVAGRAGKDDPEGGRVGESVGARVGGACARGQAAAGEALAGEARGAGSVRTEEEVEVREAEPVSEVSVERATSGGVGAPLTE